MRTLQDAGKKEEISLTEGLMIIEIEKDEPTTTNELNNLLYLKQGRNIFTKEGI